MRNKIKEFLERRPDPVSGKPGTSAYRFWKETNLSRPTAYRLVADPTYVPSGEVLDRICSTYRVQPGELLVWLSSEDETQKSSIKQDKLTEIEQSKKTIEDKPLPRCQLLRSFITVVPEVPESA